MSNFRAPMYVITEDGAHVMASLSLSLDLGFIGVKEYEQSVLDVRITHKIESNIRCYGCLSQDATWRILDTYDAPQWDYVCQYCAPIEVDSDWRSEQGAHPLIMEPIEGGYYDPMIRIVAEAWISR